MVAARIVVIFFIKVFKMKEEVKRTLAYSEESYPPMPTKGTLRWRKNILWQAWRFVVLNVKIMKIVVGGHS